MVTVNAKWEHANTEWQTQIVSTNELEAIDEIFRKQLSTLREINNALKVKLKEQVQRLEEEMVTMKANEIFNSLLDGQELAEPKNGQLEPTIANDEKSVDETNQRFDSVETKC